MMMVKQQGNNFDCGFRVQISIERFGQEDICDIDKVSDVSFKHQYT